VKVPDPTTEWFLGYMALLSAALLLVPTFVLRLPRLRDRATARIAGFYELLCIIGLAISWAGTLGFYRAFFSYDTVIHTVNLALLSYVVLDATMRAFPGFYGRWGKVWLIVAVIAMAGGVGNELFEWGGDRAFGTKMYGKPGAPLDTQYDLVADAIGALIGIAAAQKRKGWLV
jgi:uncharacterized membrane protein YjdF